MSITTTILSTALIGAIALYIWDSGREDRWLYRCQFHTMEGTYMATAQQVKASGDLIIVNREGVDIAVNRAGVKACARVQQ